MLGNLVEVQALADAVYGALGEVGILMNNAAVSAGGASWDHIEEWRRLLEVNLWGVINGVQIFMPRMLEQKTACAIINTGPAQTLEHLAQFWRLYFQKSDADLVEFGEPALLEQVNF